MTNRASLVRWVVLALLVLPVLVYWAVLLRYGMTSLLSLAPFLIPVLLALRGAIARSPLVSGAVLGVALLGSTGSGVVFLIFGVGAAYLEFNEQPRVGRTALRTVLMLAVGGLATLAALAAIAALGA